MFFISRPYWLDAGSPVLQGDNPNVPEGKEYAFLIFFSDENN